MVDCSRKILRSLLLLKDPAVRDSINLEDVETKELFRSVMDTVLIPLDISLTEKPEEQHQDCSIDSDRSVHHSSHGQTNEFVDKGRELYYLFYRTKVLKIPLQTSRLSSFLKYLEQSNCSTIRLFKSPMECNFILAGPTPSQFYFYANATEVFVEIISHGKSSVDAIKVLEELINGFWVTLASETESGVDLKWCAEPNIGDEENPGETKNVVSLSQSDEQQALRIACGGIVLERLKDNKHEEPTTYPSCFDFVPRVGSFLASQDKSGSQVKQNVKKIFKMNDGFENEKLKESKCSVENKRLKESVKYWKWKWHEMHEKFELERSYREKHVQELVNKASLLGSQSAQIAALENDLQNIRTELAETSLQLGQLSYENEKMIEEKKKGIYFTAMFKSNVSISTQTPEYRALNDEPKFAKSERVFGPCASAHSGVAGARISKQLPLNNVTGVSVQETTGEASPRKCVSLSYVPSTAVERGLYNMYKLLLLTIEDALLSHDVTKLKEWACSMFSVDVSKSVGEILLELDKKGVITSSNLNLLKDFFEKIIRIDLVYLIDCFLRGDYSLLQQTKEGLKNRSRSINPRSSLAPLRSPGKAPLTATPARSNVNPPPASSMLSTTVGQTKFQGTSKNFKLPDDQRQAQGFGKLVHRNVLSDEIVTDGCRGNGDDAKNEAEHGASMTNNNVGKADVTASNQPSPPVNHDHRPRFDMGSNGKKLSKFQRPDTAHNRRPSPQDCESDDDDASQWLCNHYKRRCYVKFDCCNKYWPCHRCHNSKSNCGQNKLKSRDTKFIKCVKCGTEQQFNEGSQFCIQCETRLAKYFCFICKHLTGTDDHPYHCDKCGICRIHGDRSFHCDVCGVCLDVQLRGNHKCRAGSAHDECCICLEDAFTGCQILPCSHKVHKECATQMIRSGITRCPICRESFAHKLERRPQPQKKTSRKKVTQW